MMPELTVAPAIPACTRRWTIASYSGRSPHMSVSSTYTCSIFAGLVITHSPFWFPGSSERLQQHDSVHDDAVSGFQSLEHRHLVAQAIADFDGFLLKGASRQFKVHGILAVPLHEGPGG